MDNRTLEEAAEWFALLRSSAASSHDRERWLHWLDETEDHRGAWQYVEAVSTRFDSLRSRGGGHASDTLARARRQRLGRRDALARMVLLACAGGVAGASWRHTPFPGWLAQRRADYHTSVGAVRQVALADGHQLWLNTDSAINYHFSPQLRRIELVAGELLLDSGSDPRPLLVDSCHGRLRALGTRFSVWQKRNSTLVSVFDGAVEITTAAHQSAVVEEGQQARFGTTAIDNPAPVKRARESWRRGMLVAEDMPLGELVVELRRYTRGHIGVADSIAGLRVVGGFPLLEPERTLLMLETVMPVRVRQLFPGWVSLVGNGE